MPTVREILDAQNLQINFKAYYEKYYFATVDVAGLANQSGALNQCSTIAGINAFSGQISGDGTALGFTRALTPADTNLTTAGKVDSKNMFIATGVGVVVEPYCLYNAAQAFPSFAMQSPRGFVASRFLDQTTLTTEFTVTNSTKWGPISLLPCRDIGPAVDMMSQTANNTLLAITGNGKAGMMTFSDPAACMIFKGNDNFNHVLNYKGDALFFTANGTATGSDTNPAITSWRLRVVLAGFEIVEPQG